ncbi:MAG: hypothetical protein ACOCQG_01210 [Candidatus Nanoarchaeia archaeon]
MGEDNSRFEITRDRKTDYSQGSTSYSGGSVTIENKTLEINYFIIKKSFEIDQGPREIEGETVMVLNGKGT